MLNFDFLEKGLGIVFPPHFLQFLKNNMNVSVFGETSVGFLKSVVLHLFLKCSQSYVNLNVKSKPKLNCL